jgi:hypothetical protein
VKDHINPDLQGRDRTFADRRAFVLSETALETAAALAAARAPAAPATISTDTVIDPNWQRNRAREAVRESAQIARRDAFLHVLGEMTFRALPLDDHEKSPFHESVLAQTAELALSLIEKWELSAAGIELLETTAGIVEGSEDPTAAVAASIVDGELAPMVEHVSAEVTRRVLEAIVEDRARSQAVEGRLAEVTETPSGDAELDAYRARRALKRSSPSLMEALYVANRRVLAEDAGREISAEVLMVETVCQYALVETLSAVGVMAFDKADVDALARRLSTRKV